jgi:hypothetical protein
MIRRVGGLTRSDLSALSERIEELRGELAALRNAEAQAAERVAELEQRLARAADHTQGLQRTASIETISRWIRHTRLHAEPLVSVILPTHDRPKHVARAIASVYAQRYPNWELLVVEDGDGADSESVVAAFAETRIRWQRIDWGGVCTARNAALRSAAGELIAYLDDDNMMDSDWLYAVGWAFGQRPDVDVLYGAFVVDDILRVDGSGSGALPELFLHPFSREALRHGNPADIGAIAHRAGLPGAWFDESLETMGDWDLLVRLTADKDPLVLPAVACYYTTDAPQRLTFNESADSDRAVVAERAASVATPGPGGARVNA